MQKRILVLAVIALLLSAAASAQKPIELNPANLKLVNSRAETVTYHGRHALKLLSAAGKEDSDEGMLAILPDTKFHDGTIEVDLSGAPLPGAKPNMRGFIGIAFRVQGAPDKFECFYVRPSNARSEDQLQRNHTLQYVSEPGFGWQKLRAESPGVYESYADMAPGEWLKLKIVVAGTKAQLYINGAEQPALIVNDLKQGDATGAIALWSHTSTDGYFANLRVK